MSSLENFRLTVFRQVAEQLSFRKAAENLYLTQPAVSLQVKALEEELGVLLFDRSGIQIKLTTPGQTLLEYARQSAEILLDAKRQIAALSGASTGALRLGASTTIAQYLLPGLLSVFCAAHPRVHPTLASGNTEQIVNALEEEKIDLGLIEGPPRSRDVASQPFLEDELVMIVPSAHEWAERSAIPLEDISTSPLLMRERGSGTRRIVDLAFERHHIKRNSLKIVMELDSTEAIKSAVEAGFGVGFVSRWAIAKDARLGPAFRIVTIEGLRLLRNLLIIVPKGPELTGLPAEFRDFLLTHTAPPGKRMSIPVK